MATLFVVGTPIGNLEDISERALRVLSQVALIAAEDTRVTGKLLARYEIQTPVVTYTDAYAPRKAERLQRVLAALEAGQDVALTSDAGMPGLSDPGYELIGAVLEAGHEVKVVPGPSAITAALVVSSLPISRFTFVGFLPRRRVERRALLAMLVADPGSLVAFEAPHRLVESLDDMAEVLGDRPVAVARELTKRFEEVWRGTLAQARAHFAVQPPRGEITLVVGGAEADAFDEGWPEHRVRLAIALLQDEDLPPAAVARVVAKLSGWRRGDVYALLRDRQA
jgi:16S rRNA (cytidine1402-2'-O)-methyltransferase